MLNSVTNTASLSLSALREQYRHYALTIRNVSEKTAKVRLVYIDYLFNYLGSPETTSGLFSKIDPAMLSAFFVAYAMQHGPGSRQGM